MPHSSQPALSKLTITNTSYPSAPQFTVTFTGPGAAAAAVADEFLIVGTGTAPVYFSFGNEDYPHGIAFPTVDNGLVVKGQANESVRWKVPLSALWFRVDAGNTGYVSVMASKEIPNLSY